MDYTSLTKDQQIQILQGRIAGWEADHFGHEINLLALQSASASDADLSTTKTALKTLEASILAGRDELSRIEGQ